MPLISCEIIIFLIWFANWFIVAGTVVKQVATFAIMYAKLYVPVVTFSSQDNAKIVAAIVTRI